MFANVTIPAHFSNNSWKLTFKLIDKEYYSYEKSFNVNILWTDNQAPEIDLDNSRIIKIYNWNKVKISWRINETWILDSVKYILNWKIVKENNELKIDFLIDANSLNSWENILEIIARDRNANESKEEIKILKE
jgi:hypothetical protein